jgi:hypothetical protein
MPVPYRRGLERPPAAAGPASAGVQTEFRAVEDSVHAFVRFPFLPEAASALETLASFGHQVRQAPPTWPGQELATVREP